MSTVPTITRIAARYVASGAGLSAIYGGKGYERQDKTHQVGAEGTERLHREATGESYPDSGQDVHAREDHEIGPQQPKGRRLH